MMVDVTLRYSVCVPGSPPVKVRDSNDLDEAIALCTTGHEVWDWKTNEVVFTRYPFVRHTARGDWVVFAADYAVHVDSKRIRLARYALLTAHRPDGADFRSWQSEVMGPLRDELRAAITERTNELMEQH